MLDVATSEARALGAGVVLVVSDEDLVVEQVAARLGASGRRAWPLADYARAREVLDSLRPDALVLDQIMDDPQSQALLEHLESMTRGAPRVVLVRYAPGPVGPFQRLHVTVVAGERWFEELPSAVDRALA